MEDYRTLQLFLDQLVKARKLKQFLHQLVVQGGQPTTVSQRSNVPRSSLGTINVIFVAPRKDLSSVSGVMTISPQSKVDEKGGSFKKFKL